MVEVKPNWKMARQISRRHTLISTSITTGILGLAALITWISLKVMGYQDAFLELKMLSKQYQQQISYLALVIHLVPVNLYAIILTLRFHFRTFRVAVFEKEL